MHRNFPTILLLLILLISSCSEETHSQQLMNDLKELSSDKYEGRKSGSAGNRNAAAYIIKRFEQIGLKSYNNNWKQAFDLRNEKVSGENLFGYIPGKLDEIIVISAHYDHLGKVGGKVYNGADDNASGVAGLLSIASYFKRNPPGYTLLFVCFDAEEKSLQGSKAFVAKPPVPLEKIVLNINLDMISRADKNDLYACGTYHYPQFKNYLPKGKGNIKLRLGHDNPKQGKDDWTSQSDHFAFHEKKIPFIYFGVEDHKDYHKPTDDFERIKPATFSNVVELITQAISEIDKAMSIRKAFRDKLIMGGENQK